MSGTKVENIQETIDRAGNFFRALQSELGKVIVGQSEVIERILVGLLAGGHVLLEGVPGLAKTLTFKTLADTLSAEFARIQFTPDLLPADLVGTTIYNPRSGEFSVKKGPVFANLVLTDEINRAPAKVQSALLESMQEKQVTIGGETYLLPSPFLVLATQNPVELEGTFPLPEAQVDRFLLRVAMGYPSREDERQILHRFRTGNPLVELDPILSTDEIRTANQTCRQVHVHPVLEDYLLDIVAGTRKHSAFALGVSPRGSLAFYRTVQALAAIRGRNYVIPDDVKTMARPVLAHRLAPSVEARLHGQSTGHVLMQVVNETPVPVEEVWSA